MSIRISPLRTPVTGVAGFELDGAVGRSDHLRFSQTISESRREGHAAFVLDLTRLGSISRGLAREIIAAKSDLEESGGSLEIFGANVAVARFLRDHLGQRAMTLHATRAEALDAIGVQASGRTPVADPTAAFDGDGIDDRLDVPECLCV